MRDVSKVQHRNPTRSLHSHAELLEAYNPFTPRPDYKVSFMVYYGSTIFGNEAPERCWRAELVPAGHEQTGVTSSTYLDGKLALREVHIPLP